MTINGNLVAFIFMALATMAILVLGTLGAAGLLHRPGRGKSGEQSPGSHPERPTEEAGARRGARSEATSARNGGHGIAVVPLGSGPSPVPQPNPPTAGERSRDHENPPDSLSA
jgi:hypothetical protein